MSLGVDQRRASAQGDVVGGDKITELHIHKSTASSGGVVEQLLRKLEAEIADNAQTQETIQALKQFYNRRSDDGIEGTRSEVRCERQARRTTCRDGKEGDVRQTA